VHHKANDREQQRICGQRAHLRRAVDLPDQSFRLEPPLMLSGKVSDELIAPGIFQSGQIEDWKVGSQLPMAFKADRATGQYHWAICKSVQRVLQARKKKSIARDLIEPVQQ